MTRATRVNHFHNGVVNSASALDDNDVTGVSPSTFPQVRCVELYHGVLSIDQFDGGLNSKIHRRLIQKWDSYFVWFKFSVFIFFNSNIQDVDHTLETHETEFEQGRD